MRMTTTTPRLASALAVAILFTLAACDAARPIAGAPGADTTAATCTRCHGDATRAESSALLQAAPPKTASGADAGAHLVHLRGGTFRSAIACTECHAVPQSTSHSDGKVDLAFGPLATLGGTLAPALSNGTCSGVYCHGASLDAGGTRTAPRWSGFALDGCRSCHGYPPTSHQASQTDCATCHPGTVTAQGTLNLAGGLHVNGTVDVLNAHGATWGNPVEHGRAANADLASCKRCHGTDLAGGSTGVSCDSCHGAAGFASWRSNCTFCHGTQIASYTGADLGKAAPPVGTQGETATTDRAVGAHQRHLAGGAIGNALACTECHAVPVDMTHVDGTGAVAFGAGAKRGGATPAWNGTSCASTYCHGSTLAAGGTNHAPSWTGGAAQAACGTCHGAPPPAPHTTSTACGSCHTGYTQTTVSLTTHINGTVEASGSHAAGWGAKDQHGYTANRSGLASCKGCHGTNLDGVGGTGPSCASCHSSAGFASWQTSCTFCHGDRASGRASPPVDTQGGSATTNVSVGVHSSHMGTALMTGMACAQCHPDRTGSNAITDSAHVDGNGIAEVSFGALAKTGGALAAYTRTSATAASCAATYCHGGFTGGTSATMSWTSTTQVSCTSCHGLPPSTGRHGNHSGRSCGDCHPGYTRTAVAQASHMNGTKQVGNQITAWDSSTRTCTNSCHGSETW